MKNSLIFLLLALVLSACTETKKPDADLVVSDGTFEKSLMEQLILAEEGQTIEIPEGIYNFNRQLSLNDVKHVTLKGAGMGRTILSFKGQLDGGEGILIKADNFTIEDLTIQDTEGDGLKIQGATNVVIRNVETTWTEGMLESNGGYGIYPVSCTNVLVEKCEASYASDAGIYVGQSTNVVVRENYAHHNVAGIEIENCVVADVYENLSEENTGGLLIFDMPNLPLANGHTLKIHHNKVINNNNSNFSPEGGVVNILPAGTGMLILASNNVEISNNVIDDYKTIGIAIISYYLTGDKFKEGGEFNPYAYDVSVHDNKLSTSRLLPDLSRELGILVSVAFQGPMDFVIDGINDPTRIDANGNLSGEDRICLRNNGEKLDFANLKAKKGVDPMELLSNIEYDITKFDCSLEPVEVKDASAWMNDL